MSEIALAHIPLVELRRLRALDLPPAERAALLADAFRLNTLYMIMRAGSGHIGTSFSSMDIVTWLHLYELQDSPVGEEPAVPQSIYFSSKGHDAPGLYSVLAGLEVIAFDLIHNLRRLGGLPGHPDRETTPAVHVNTGSLGMGVAKAKGIARAQRLNGERRHIYVLFGDGELQEGQFWESLQPAANESFGEIVGIVDANKIQSDTWVADVSDLGSLVERIAAHGWAVETVDGHDIQQLAEVLERLQRDHPDTPKMIVADTIKGRGVREMEPHDLAHDGRSLYGFHSGAPSVDVYERGTTELLAKVNDRLAAIGAPELAIERDTIPGRVAPTMADKLVAAYGDELKLIADERADVVAFDADLVLDTGLIPFRDAHPDRFFECGIAEQDMVSQAGAIALAGKLPLVHSFACFLSTRPNEQIYNNATENSKVIYTGSLAGLVPGGPGHSHQSVRDISALGAVPGLRMIEPANERETRAALRWAVEQNDTSTYIRLVSIPVELPFALPDDYDLRFGRGTKLRDGKDVAVVAYGPVMLTQAWLASDRLAEQGMQVSVINLPWLRDIDANWLAEAVGDVRLLVTVDNHYASGGQGEMVVNALAALGSPLATRTLSLAVDRVPVCGTNDEVLAAHGLDATSIARRVEQKLG